MPQVKLWLLILIILRIEFASALQTASIKFPVLANGMYRVDLNNASDQEALNKILGNQQYESMIKKGQDYYLPFKIPVGESSADQIANLAREMRDKVCKALKKGDEFKFTMTWDASAKIWGIGVSGSSGIEINIRCG